LILKLSIPGRLITFFLTIIVLLWFVYPYAWMTLSSFKENREIYNPLSLFPNQFDFRYLIDVFSGKYIDLKSAFVSSFWIALIQAIGSVLISASTGFILARYRFPGKQLVFLLSVSLIILPKQALSIPIFEWMTFLSLNGGYSSVILPGFASGIGILFFMQVFKNLPQEYLDMARVEGASGYRIFLTFLPMVLPAMATYGVIHFILAWHDHLIPLLLLEDSKRTLPLALATLYDPSQRVPQAIVMAASTFMVIPIALLFGLLYRQFKSAISEVLVH